MPPYLLCPRRPLASAKFQPYLEQPFQPPSWFCGLKGLSWAALLDSPRGSGARGVAADWQLGRKPPGGFAKMLLQLWTCMWHRPRSLSRRTARLTRQLGVLTASALRAWKAMLPVPSRQSLERLQLPLCSLLLVVAGSGADAAAILTHHEELE